jgi:hypothetical protein
MQTLNQERVKTYISQLREERKYWAKHLRGKSAEEILNQSYARAKVSALTFAIDQGIYWLKEIR